MEEKLKDYVLNETFSVLVNYPYKFKNTCNNKEFGYVLNKSVNDNITVMGYLKLRCNVSDEKLEKVLIMVELKASLKTVLIRDLTRLEYMKLQLAVLFINVPRVIVLEHFFDDMIYKEKEYFKRLFRHLMTKPGISFIIISNDMNFVCETVKSFYLFNNNEKSKLISDFYDEEIYEYVDEPYAVSLVKYLEELGFHIDHDYTFNETLKAIYRGVQ